ncbi:MAG: GNAT family N-acetyltransferase [Pseudomonadota bacterium]|nr:GNAT family N-acetyltransferase [Pseudomonadota bacterium]
MTLRTEIVKTPRRLAEIGPQWDALWERGERSVFQNHGWITAWWSSKGTSDTSILCVGLCWSADELVAVMPFVTRWHRGVRVLEWAAKDCSDYCDSIVDPGLADSRRALEDVWAAVAISGGFDVAYLSHMRPDAALSGLLEGERRRTVRLRPGHRADRSLQVRSYGVGGHDWFRGLNKKARNNHTRGKRILGETGAVTVAVYEAEDAIDAVLERMIDLKREWLVSTGQSNRILTENAVILRALVEELRRQRALRVFSICSGDALVAASLNIMAGTRMQAFFAAYDPQFDRASPGTLVMVEYLMWAFDHGITEVDFLCGEEEYKYKFANAQIDLASYVGARTLIGRAALAVGERLDRAHRPGVRAEMVQPGRVLEV